MSADQQYAAETFGPITASERDPHGLAPNAPGAKLDHGKNDLALVLHGFARALEAVGHVGTFGARKYTPNGWVQVPDGQHRYTSAMYRHLLAEGRGEQLDPQTSLHHAAHAEWNALARLELALREHEQQKTTEADHGRYAAG